MPPGEGRAVGKTIKRAWRETSGGAFRAVTGRNAVERAPDRCSCAAARPSRRGFVATGLLALLDDITSILNDVSAMTVIGA